MSHESLVKLQDLFLRALEIPAEERDTWLSRQCATDDELRRDVQVLLAADERPVDPLEAGAAGVVEELMGHSVSCPLCRTTWQVDDTKLSCPTCANADANQPPPGGHSAELGPKKDGTGCLQFGDYELLHEIARGGQGIVYKARQLKLNRLVALKMILSGELASDERIERFQSEAQAAAKLDHPGIVPVYEVGQQNGQHFYSMGLIEGESLHERIRKGGPQSPKRAAELLKAVSEAVEFGHSKGIIHRDIKPQNILLDEADTPRVTDFGLARQGDSEATVAGHPLGTPSFMPPEQAQGNTAAIGPVSDVYSLGATLYFLLTGRPPFQAASPAETVRQVIDTEPVSPRQLNPDVPRDLETICLKCLEKDSAKRYASAQHLAAELDRFLTHKPILARPVGRFERSRRWCKRNPWGAVVVGLLTMFAVVGPIVAVVQVHLKQQADENSARAKAEKDRADEKVVELGISMKAGKAAIDNYVDAALEDELLADASFQPLRRKLLAHAVTYYQGYIRDHKHDEDSRAEVADSLMRLASISAFTGFQSKATAPYRQAIALWNSLVRGNPGVPQYRLKLAICHNNVGRLQNEVGSRTDAIASLDQSVNLLRHLAREHPRVAEYRRYLAASYQDLGVAYSANGQTREAAAAFRDALKILDELNRTHRDVAEYQASLAACHNNIANLHIKEREPNAALRAFQRARRILMKTRRDSSEATMFRHLLAVCENNIGNIYLTTERPRDALPAFQHALALLEPLAQENPHVTEYWANLATSQIGVGNAYNRIGKPNQGLPSFHRAQQVLKKLANDHREVVEYRFKIAANRIGIANCQFGLGDLSNALQAYRQARTLVEQLVADNAGNPEYRSSLESIYASIGACYRRTGDRNAALGALSQAVGICAQLVCEFPQVIKYRHHLAIRHKDSGLLQHSRRRPQDAIEAFQQARMLYEQLARDVPENPMYLSELAKCHNNLGICFRDLQKPADALREYRQAVKIHEQLVNSDPTVSRFRRHLAGTHHNVGNLRRALGKFEAAMTAYAQALMLREMLVCEHPHVSEYRVDAGASSLVMAFLFRHRKPKDALDHLENAISNLETVLVREPGHRQGKSLLGNAHRLRAELLDESGQHCEAVRSWRRARKLDMAGLHQFFEARLSLSLARCGKHAEAAALADKLLNAITDGFVAYSVASTYAILADGVAGDGTLPPTERQRLRGRYADRAVRLLQLARRYGYLQLAQHRLQFSSTPELNALRHRDDFRVLARSVGVLLPAWAVRPRTSQPARR